MIISSFNDCLVYDCIYLNLLHRLFSHQDDADIDDPLPESSSGQTLGEGMAVEGGVAVDGGGAVEGGVTVDGGEAVKGGQVEQATPKSIKCEEYVFLMLNNFS